MCDEECAVITPLQPMIFVFNPAQFDPIRQHRAQFLPRFPDRSLTRTLPGLNPAAAAFQMIAQAEFILSQHMNHPDPPLRIDHKYASGFPQRENRLIGIYGIFKNT